MLRGLAATWRRARDYVKYDLREIIAPTSIPDPPDYSPPPKLTWAEYKEAVRDGWREYLDTWGSKPARDAEGGTTGERAEAKGEVSKEEPTIVEELATAARGGATTLKPALQKVYVTRAQDFKNAVSAFVEGYREGIADVDDSTDASPESQSTTGPPSRTAVVPQATVSTDPSQTAGSSLRSGQADNSASQGTVSQNVAPNADGPPGEGSQGADTAHVSKRAAEGTQLPDASDLKMPHAAGELQVCSSGGDASSDEITTSLQKQGSGAEAMVDAQDELANAAHQVYESPHGSAPINQNALSEMGENSARQFRGQCTKNMGMTAPPPTNVQPDSGTEKLEGLCDNDIERHEGLVCNKMKRLPSRRALQTWTVCDLVAACKDYGIVGYSKKRKAQIIDLIVEHKQTGRRNGGIKAVAEGDNDS